MDIDLFHLIINFDLIKKIDNGFFSHTAMELFMYKKIKNMGVVVEIRSESRLHHSKIKELN
jgi:hypothetical protein